MSTTNVAITISGLYGNPIVADDYHPSIQRLIDLLNKMKSGNLNAAATAGTVTMSTSGTAVFATGTVTFSGLATAADTVTIAGTALTATKKNATGTVTAASAQDADTVTIAGVTFTAKTSPTAGNLLQFALGVSDTACAANLVAAVNAYPDASQVVTATSALGVVTFRAVSGGTAGNSIALASSDNTRFAVSGAALTGGAAAANNAWDPGNTATTAAAAFVAAVNASSTQAVSGNVVAANVAGVVTLTARLPGPGGNVTLTKSGTNIAVSGATLTGGSLGTAVTYTF